MATREGLPIIRHDPFINPNWIIIEGQSTRIGRLELCMVTVPHIENAAWLAGQGS